MQIDSYWVGRELGGGWLLLVDPEILTYRRDSIAMQQYRLVNSDIDSFSNGWLGGERVFLFKGSSVAIRGQDQLKNLVSDREGALVEFEDTFFKGASKYIDWCDFEKLLKFYEIHRYNESFIEARLVLLAYLGRREDLYRIIGNTVSGDGEENLTRGALTENFSRRIRSLVLDFKRHFLLD